MRFQLLILDLDGVLVDSRANMETAWNTVRSELGVTTSFDDYFSLIGRPFADILTLLGLSGRHREIETVFRLTSSRNLNLARFYPDVESTLLALRDRGVRFGVVTSKDALRTGAILARLPVEFQSVHTPNGIYRGKPAPDHLLAALAETNTDPAQAVYVGDMEPDAEAATRAGLAYVHAAWGYGTVPADCIAVAGSFGELKDIVLMDAGARPSTS